MRGINRNLQKEIKRTIAFLLVICMLPLSSFPAKAVEVEEVSAENKLQQMEVISEDTVQRESETVQSETVQPLATQTEVQQSVDTDRASAYLDPAIQEKSIGDITVSGNWVLEEDTVVDELVLTGEKVDLNGYTLTVCEDLILEKGTLTTSSGDLIVWGDFRVQSRIWSEEKKAYVYGISEGLLYTSYSESDPSYILVAGDIYIDSVNFGSKQLCGTLELKGSLFQKKSEEEQDTNIHNIIFDFPHVLILSGNKQQVIQWDYSHTTNKMGHLYIENYSEEGIVFDGTPVIYNGISMKRGQKVSGRIRVTSCTKFYEHYYGGDIETDSRYSSAIHDDIEIDGNIILRANLGIYANVTVNKNIIVEDALTTDRVPYLNLGDNIYLKVMGDIDASQTTSTWEINAYSNNTVLYVKGDAILNNVDMYFGGDSRFELEGNLDLRNTSPYTSMYGDSTLVFCGDKKQEMLLGQPAQMLYFNNLEINNTSAEGVHLDYDDVWFNSVKTNGNLLYFDGVKASEPFKLTEDTILEEDYYFVGGTVDLNGYKLTCNGDISLRNCMININEGILEAYGNLNFKYWGGLCMDSDADQVHIYSDFDMGEGREELTAGELTFYGDVQIDTYFKTEDTHITRILRKNYTDTSNQTIKIVDDSTGEETTPTQKPFANLYISRNPEKYYTCAHGFEELAENLYYYGYPEESPTQVTGLTVSDAGYYDITLKYDEATDDVKVAGYEIYRDGTLVGTTEGTVYTDSGLDYHTEYEYQVYAYDELGNRSPASGTISAITKEDVVSPEKVEGLTVKKQSTGEVRLSWNAGKDDLKVSYYNIYRDGELLPKTASSTTFSDQGLEGEKYYEYQVAAVDLGENESEISDPVTAHVELPKILAYYPEEETIIGGNSTDLSVTLKNPLLGAAQYISIDYYDYENARWESICTRQYVNKNSKKDESTITNTWYHSSLKKDGNVEVRFTVGDEYGNRTSKTVIYYLDRTGPTPPEMISLAEKDTNVTITWSPSISDETKGYRLYGRKQGDDYVCLLQVSETGAATYTYTHKNLTQEATYEYYIESIDGFGNKSTSEIKTITIERDVIPPTLPTDVSIQTRSGSAITLTWNGATDNVAVTAYNLYRNGELVAEGITGHTYKDTGLEENTLYTYQLTAIDAAGNESEKSEGLDSAVCMPEIIEIRPKDYEIIGGETVDIEVCYKDCGNSTGNTVQLFWYDHETQEWNAITPQPLTQEYYRNGVLRSKATWTFPEISSETDVDMDVKVVVTDIDGNTDEQIVTYTIDKTAPTPPAEFEATENNGIVVLTFSPSSSVDTSGYILYRKTAQEDTFSEIARIEGRTVGWYQDKDVETGVAYTYRLTAYDTYGAEGTHIESNTISVSEDSSLPTIKSMTPQAGDVNKTVNVCVEGKDNRAVTKVSYYIRTDEETEWTFLAEKEAENNTAVYAWDTTAVSDGTYYIKAEVSDKAGNKNENLYQRRYKVDNTGISKIELGECTAGSTIVQLEWEDVTEEDFAYFHVEQKVGEAWISHAKVTDKLGYVVTGLMPEQTYTFRVTGYDRVGNAGEPSDEITLTTYADTIAPSILKIDPVSSYYGETMFLSMYVRDNASLAKAVFSYSTDGETYTVINKSGVRAGISEETITYQWDTSELPEGTISIRFEVYDTAGNHNQLINGEKQVENTYIIDHTSPEQIQKPIASGAEGYVGVIWKKSDAEDIRAYRVYRSTSADTGYVLVSEQNRINYYDTSVVQGQIYYYKISAVDMAGNESEWSDYAFGNSFPDTVAPVITGISPADGEKLGAHPTFSVLATDNAQLQSVRMEYRKKDSTDIWQEISTAAAGGREKYIRLSFDASQLSEEQEYVFRAVAYDRAGNASEYVSACYSFDLTPPQAPKISTSSGSYRIGISISGNTTADFDRYEIYRKALGENEYKCIQSTKESSYEDTTAKVNTIYYYKVRTYDVYGNYSESAVSNNYANDIDTIAPVAALAQTYTAVTGLSMRFDGTSSTDNVRIIKYEWDFGDGTKKTGAKPVHTYKESDTYTISLTVTDGAGNQSMAIATIRVFDGENYGQTMLKVMDENGAPIAGAHVYIKTGNSDSEIIRTRADSNGDVSVVTKAGVYEFAAYADGYLPKEDTIRISNYEKLSKEIILQKGEIVSGEMTATRMTLDDLVEYGVDLSNPENYNTFTFRVELKLEETPLPVTYEFVGVPEEVPANSSTMADGTYYVCLGKGTGNGADPNIQAICREEDGELKVESVVYLSTTQSVSWLKDMYDVALTVINHADSSFPIEQASATLSLPEGLSLAQTKSGQTPTTQLGTIAGQTSAKAHWVVRGDKSGTYHMDASFHGILMPFEVPVSNLFTTEQEFEVKAGEGMEIIVQPEDAMYLDSRYYIQFKIRNNSDRDFYNVSTTLGEYIEPAQTVQYITKDAATGALLAIDSRTQGQTYHSSSAAKCKTIPVLYEGDTVKIGVFSPGEEICCTYVKDVKGNMTADYYYKLADSLVEALEGANLGVKVTLQSIPSHLSRYICYTAGTTTGAQAPEKEKETYGDPVDVASGGFTQQINSLSVTGASTLELSLAYNSLLTEYEGQSGYGWSHSYEQSLKDIGGVIELRSTPYSVASFVSDELNKDTMYGYKSGNDIVLDDEAQYLGSYTATGSAMKGAVIEKKEENGKCFYVLTDLSGTISTFDSDGKLIACEDKNGKSITLTHKEDKLTIKDDISGEKLVLSYEEGKISSVSDAHGRKCSFTYDKDGNLTAYEDVSGNKTKFTYDDNHRMLTCINADGVTVVENTYDDKGRVLSQIEAGSEKKSVFTYDETENGGLITEITKRDGSILAYESDEKGNILKESDEMGAVTEYLFDRDGNLLDETAPDGSRTMYEYDKAGNMTASYDTAGNATTYTYDANNNPVTVTSADGQTSRYEYNEKNLLTGYTSPLGVKTTYEYDSYGNLIEETTPGLGTKTYAYENGRKISGSDYSGNISTFTYDAYGNLSSTTDALGNKNSCVFDAAGRVVSENDANGVTKTYTYDKGGNKTSETIGDQTIRYSYDEAGRLVKLTNAMGDETLYAYDTEGNLTSITYPDKTTSRYAYDAKGRVVEETDPDGSEHSYVYDTMGFLTSETHVGITTAYTYFPNGKLLKETFADGTSNTYTYDANWNVISVMDQDENTTTYTYDAMSHVTSVTDALGNKVSYTYDENGRKIKATDARGYVTTYAYDGNGNCIKTVTPDGTQVAYTYDGAGNLTKASTQTEMGEVSVSYKYDAKGQLVETTDALGNVTKISYDIYGNVWKVTDAYGNIVEENTYDAINQLIQVKDATGSIAAYSYDKSANVTKVTTAAGSGQERSYVYSYDQMGRLLSSIDPANGNSAYTYNSAGQVTSVTDPMGGVTGYTYDTLQRLTAVVSPIQTKTEYTYNAQGLLAKETNARAQDTEYSYDALGRITEMKDDIGTIRYTYDENGNVLTVSETQGLFDTKEIKRTYDCMNRVTSYTDYNGNTIAYGYDELGNRISLTYPGGEIVRYSYDKNGKLLSVTDPDGAVTRYAYDKNGRMSKVTRPDGSEESFTYNTAGQLTEQVDEAADGSVIHHYTYTYDAYGNVTEMTGKKAADYSVLKNVSMTYDADNRLITYNGEEVLYDADGNMTFGPLDGQMAEFTYDCRNRLVKVETENGAATEYEYDAENTRIAETDGEYKRVYVTDVESTYSQLLTETVYSKNLLGLYAEEEETKRYIYGAGLVSEQTDFTTLYYHYNNIGSTTEITDQTGAVIYDFQYGTYGELLSESHDIRFLYNGQLGVQTDRNGLYYMRARYYNTDIKRFINRDVVNGSIENSQSLNKYSYVQGNPVKLTDPFGLAPVDGDTYSVLSTIGHTILDVVGVFVDGADLINALWYAAEGNTYMAVTSAIAALPAVGSFVSGSLKICMKGSKAASKASNLIAQSTRLISHGAQMTMSAIDSYYAAIDYKQAKANGESGKAEALQLTLSVAGTIFSSGGATNSGKRLADAMYEGQHVKKAVDKVSRGVSSAATETDFVMNKGKKVTRGNTTVRQNGALELDLQFFAAGSRKSGSDLRPTWRQSELDAAKDFPDYSEQRSFLAGKEVKYGTKGSVRPDFYKTGSSIDVKNYNIENASGRNNLVRNIAKQYQQRIGNLPSGTRQTVLIDIRGQNISNDSLSSLYNSIMQRTNNGITVRFKMN